MNQLEQARQTIDRIDQEMAHLFEQRMDALEAVVAYKKQTGMPIHDREREASLIAKNVERIKNPKYAPFYADYIRYNISLSRQYQAQVMGKNRVAYPGMAGCYAHIAAQHLFPHCEALPYASWSEVFDAVENGTDLAGIVPFEERHPDEAASVLDLCFHHNLYVSAVYDLPISHSLVAMSGTNLWQIKHVYSHPMAIQQSENFLKTMNLVSHPMPSSAQAAQFVAQQQDPTLAAITCPETAALYGLVEIAKGIHADRDGTARFMVLSRACPTDGNHFSLLFTVDNQPGKLAQVIQEIGMGGYNMETIQSHSRPGLTASYYFYAELNGSLQDAQTLLKRLTPVCHTVRLLGVYQL